MAQTNTAAANGTRKFGLLDKVSYAAGDFGCNMSFALKGTLTIYWTQFMGINQILMAGLLLLVQVWDAINDPLIGSMVDADRRHYKRNKFLAYVNAGGIGLTVAGALCFLPFPGLPEVAEAIMFVAGYILWDAFYTVANVPYGSLLSLITDNPIERSQLSTWRSVGAMIANIGTSILLPMLIYDASNALMGERIFWIALLMGGLGLICFQFMVRTTVVRINTEVKAGEETPKFNIFKAMLNFVRNRAALGATLSAISMFLGMYGASTATQVLFQAYFKNAQISGLMAMVSYVGMFAFLPFIKPLVGKVGKKEMCTIGAVIAVAAYILMFILPITPDGKGLVMYALCQLLAAVGNGFSQCVAWALMADAMDYEEWKYGERNEGTTYALYSFFRKLAQGVGPSLGIVLATAVGYNATLQQNQPAEVALNMRYLVPGMYLLGAVLALVAYGLVYNLDRKTLATMTKELEERHAAK
ncbi:MAG TPA: glycoside-pentoside-hexuronide (GPH):cation symporter [Candidatus Gemmiger stercoravium]|nr:glycoside-pentoside-hexuronide (GPH):cation symporter [Candidatus Gemmiger stercoravium]